MAVFPSRLLFMGCLILLYQQVSSLTRKSNNLLSYNVSYYYFLDREIFDLEYSSSSFTEEVANWQVSSPASTNQTYSFCCDKPLLGGYGLIGRNTVLSRTYNSLPSHNTAVFTFSVWFLGYWADTDEISITISSQFITYYRAFMRVHYDQTKWTGNICGVSNLYGLKTAKLYIATTSLGSSATISIANTFSLGSNIPQFGIRDIKITFSNYAYAILDKCGTANPSSVVLSASCPFIDNKYYNSNTLQYENCDKACETCALGATSANCISCNQSYFFDGLRCTSCDSSCLNCNGSLATQCLSCKSGEYLYSNSTCLKSCQAPYLQRIENNITYCDFPCNSSTYYYSNGSCLSTCPAPFVSQIDGTSRFCNFPCAGNSSLALNDSCLSECNFPFQIFYKQGYKYCEYPCQSFEYLYPNTSCMGQCLQPFQPLTTSSGKLCVKPCPNSPNIYLYPNNSCLEQCSLPFLQSNNQGIDLCKYPCKTGEYLYSNGSCSGSCLFPLQIKQKNGIDYCDSPCLSDSFLTSNGSCLSECNFPFQISYIEGFKYCEYPCQSSEYIYPNSSCMNECLQPFQPLITSSGMLCVEPCPTIPNIHLYPNNSCLDTCDLPFIQTNNQGVNLCNYPCETGEYLHSNGSCSANCPFPFQSSQKDGILTCDLPCFSSQYLFANGSCSQDCPGPYLTKNIYEVQLCEFPCNVHEYLHSNGSCLSSCNFPFRIRKIPDGNFCEFSCLSTQYLTGDDLCLDHCPFPMIAHIANESKVCLNPCPDSNMFFYTKENICKSTCPEPYTPKQTSLYNLCQIQNTFEALEVIQTTTASIVSISILTKSMISLGDSGGITIAVFAKMLQYIKYLNVSYSDGLELALHTWNSSYISLSVFSNLSGREEDDSSIDFAPPIFSKWGVGTDFLSNFSQDFLILIVISGILLMLAVLEFSAGKYRNLASKINYLHKVRILIQNLLLIRFYDGLGDIILFSCLQYQATSSSQTISRSSVAISVILVIIAFLVLSFHYYLLKNNEKMRKFTISPEPNNNNSKHQEKVLKLSENFYIFFKDFKDKLFSQQAFLFFFTMRDIIFNIILGTLFNHPLTEAVLILILNIAMILYLVIKRPVKEIIEGIQYAFCELILLITNTSVLVMSILDSANSQDRAPKEHLSNAIIAVNLIFNFAILVLLGAKTFMEIKHILHERKVKNKSKIVPHVKVPSLVPNQTKKLPSSPLDNNKQKMLVFQETKLAKVDEDEQKTNIDSEYEQNVNHRKKNSVSENEDRNMTQGQRLLESIQNMDNFQTNVDSILMSDGESRAEIKLDSRKFSVYHSKILNISMKDVQLEPPVLNNTVSSASPDKKSIKLLDPSHSSRRNNTWFFPINRHYRKHSQGQTLSCRPSTSQVQLNSPSSEQSIEGQNNSISFSRRNSFSRFAFHSRNPSKDIPEIAIKVHDAKSFNELTFQENIDIEANVIPEKEIEELPETSIKEAATGTFKNLSVKEIEDFEANTFSKNNY